VSEPQEKYFYFGNRLLVAQDRLGSAVRHLPYGEEQTVTANDRLKFATYWRDGSTGLDDAWHRSYSPTHGRFTNPDPYMASGGPADPGSWNRYAYVGGDPVNFVDPDGRVSTYVGLGLAWKHPVPEPPRIASTTVWGRSYAGASSGFGPVWLSHGAVNAGAWVGGNLQALPNMEIIVAPPVMERPPWCDKLPTKFVTGTSVSFGGIAVSSIGVEIVMDLRSGDIFSYQTMSAGAGWAGGMTAGAYAGFAWDSSPTTANRPSGFSVSVSAPGLNAGVDISGGRATALTVSTGIATPPLIGVGLSLFIGETYY
jgi:RHS repeat-associated protein